MGHIKYIHKAYLVSDDHNVQQMYNSELVEDVDGAEATTVLHSNRVDFEYGVLSAVYTDMSYFDT